MVVLLVSGLVLLMATEINVTKVPMPTMCRWHIWYTKMAYKSTRTAKELSVNEAHQFSHWCSNIAI